MNFHPLVPEPGVSHFENSLSFYTEVLPFHVEFQRPEHQFAFLSYHACQLMIAQENGVWKTGALEYPYGGGIHLAMLVETLDVLLQSLQQHHYPLFAQPTEHWYRQGQILLGRWEFLVMDPDGSLLRFAHSLGHRPVFAPQRFVPVCRPGLQSMKDTAFASRGNSALPTEHHARGSSFNLLILPSTTPLL
jgi:catechol 2,3-dioxygenase-like lactoylglutathione lyase family enzyme